MAGNRVPAPWPLVSAGLIAALAALLASAPAEASPGITTRVSVRSDGTQVANAGSITTSISEDGRMVAFESGGHFVADDAGQHADIHIHDRQTGVTERIGLGPGGEEGNESSWNPILSASGRYVLFYSSASNLVPSDANGLFDTFIYDRDAGLTELVSVGDDGHQADDVGSSPTGVTDDGRLVLFTSFASNLVPGDTNGEPDVFLRDRELETTQRMNISQDREQANGYSFGLDITPDGRFIVFSSDASNLVPKDSNGVSDVFVLDQRESTLDRIAIANPKGTGDLSVDWASISNDGRFVGIGAEDPGVFAYAFVYNRITDAATRLGLGAGGVEPNGGSRRPRISGDGTVVIFSSDASNVVPDAATPCGVVFFCTHVYAYDRLSGTTEAVSVTREGKLGNGGADTPSVSGSGSIVAFESSSTDLVDGDTNGTGDVFVRDRQASGGFPVAGGAPAGSRAAVEAFLLFATAGVCLFSGAWLTRRGFVGR